MEKFCLVKRCGPAKIFAPNAARGRKSLRNTVVKQNLGESKYHHHLFSSKVSLFAFVFSRPRKERDGHKKVQLGPLRLGQRGSPRHHPELQHKRRLLHLLLLLHPERLQRLQHRHYVLDARRGRDLERLVQSLSHDVCRSLILNNLSL